ncbi:MAG: hypothetical protein IPN34_23495 [Planctomycetes bacterium]|nr:hypothetical protein [Planctomycetota bacterium]
MPLLRRLGSAPARVAYALLAALGALAPSVWADGPQIDLWYGTSQTFGALGHPQRFANIVGRVSDEDGVASLSYRLNGGPLVPLSIGPDGRRLQAQGDFNADLPRAALLDGANTVLFFAVDTLQNESVATLHLQYHAQTSWPRTSTTTWSALSSVTEGAQVADGVWHIDASGARPTTKGYDRTLLLGEELAWRSYEVLVPITLHGFDPAGFLGTAVAPAFGITCRWKGHTERIYGEQPLSGWTQQGGGVWYELESGGGARLSLVGFQGLQIDRAQVLPLGTRLWWKLRCETQPNSDTFYAYKIWPDGSDEPIEWLASGTESPDDLQTGSLLFIAHYADVSIGDVQVTALEDEVAPPQLRDLQWQLGARRARATWHSDEPTDFELAHGLTPALELGLVRGADLLVRHGALLIDLLPSTTYHYELRARDGRGQSASALAGTFTTAATAPPQPSGLVSDDFSGSQLDESRWIFVDPRNDAQVRTNGQQLEIEVPAGQSHGAWYDTGGNQMPRVVQSVADADFEIEARFDSPLDAVSKAQGLVVEQDAGNYLRFDFLATSLGTRIWVGGVKDGYRPLLFEQGLLTLGTPMSMRVWREGPRWTVWHSFDGERWVNSVVFEHALHVTRVGVAAGNAEGTAHTAEIDYFAVTLDPVDPEDGSPSKLVTQVHGRGSLLRNPDLASYPESLAVELTALPEPGWLFEGWVGDVQGIANPLQLTTTAETRRATALFSTGSDLQPPILSQIQLSSAATSATVTWRTDEPALCRVLYGPTTSYDAAIEDGRLLLQHRAVLENLQPGRIYHFRLEAEDRAGNRSASADRTLRTQPAGNPLAIDSDDFSGAALDESQWSFVDPNGDSSFAFDEQRLAIAVPATSTHDAWTQTTGNQLARVMQAAPNTDCAVHAAFESPLALDSQAAGLLFEQDEDDYLKIELVRQGGAERLFAGSVREGWNATVHGSLSLALPRPVHLRIQRQGSQWSIATSPDGSSWTPRLAFTQTLELSAVGVYAGNRLGTPHTVLCDYLFDAAHPIEPEDGDRSALVVNVLGGGQVLRHPMLPRYGTGQVVELSAVAQSGWVFSHWSGSASGSENPLVVAAGAQPLIVAHFARDATPPQILGLQALPAGRRATIVWTTDEPAAGRVEWGRTSALGELVASSVRRSSHLATITDLSPGEEIYYQVCATDAAGNSVRAPLAVLETRAGFVSDDFAGAALEAARWRLEDPSEQAVARLVDRRIELVLPRADTEPPLAPVLLLQELEHGDLELETALDSGFSAPRGQSAGLAFESDARNGFRFGATWSGDHLRLTCERRANGVRTRSELPLSGQPLQLPIHLRVARRGDQWTLEHSFDRLIWSPSFTFTQGIGDLRAGLFAENRAAVPYTAQLDYVFERTEPIVPEDGASSALVVNAIGPGRVQRTPELPRHAAGQVVSLLAEPFPGARFVGWEGAHSGTENPLSITVGTSTSITARFERE